MSLKTWNQYLSDTAVKLGETILRDEHLAQQQTHLRSLIAGGMLLPLLVERQGCLQIAPAEETLQKDDRLIYLLYDPKPKLLKLLSGSSQLRLTLETLPEVEYAPVTASLDADSTAATDEMLDQESLEASIAVPADARLVAEQLKEATIE